MPDLPEEAVEAALRGFALDGTESQPPFKNRFRSALELAAPAIEKQVRERVREPARRLIEYLVYSECARCGLLNPERPACQCAVCDRLADLIGELRTALATLEDPDA